MVHIALKIFFWILTALVWVFLLLLSFSFESVSPSDISFISPSFEPELSYNTSGKIKTIYQQELNPLDTLYTDLNITPEIQKNNISLLPGNYVFEIHDINSSYTLQTPSSAVLIDTPGVFIVSIQSDTLITVASVSWVLELQLHNNSWDMLNQVILYPHMYIKWNPKRGVLVRDGDITRVSQVFQIWYIPYDTSSPEKIFNHLAYDNTFNTDFFTQVAHIIRSKYTFFQTNISIETTVNLFPWEKRLQQYANWFINNEKKRAYFQHLIRQNIILLITQFESPSMLISSIIKNLNDLHTIDTAGYRDIRSVIDVYYEYVMRVNKDIWVKQSFGKLMQELWENAKKREKYDQSSLVISDLFFQQYFWDHTDIYQNISLFTQNYIHDWGNAEISFQTLPYTLFFLEAVMTQSEAWTGVPFPLFLQLLKDYQTIAEPLYTNAEDKTIQSGIFIHESILEKISYTLRNYAFLETRNDSGLLERNNTNITPIEREEISTITGQFFDFLSKNKWVLPMQQKTQDILLSYQWHQSIIDEMLLALSDYESYITQYDITKKQLLQEYTIKSKQEKYLFSPSEVAKYLSRFTWVQIDASNIHVQGYNFCQNQKNTDIISEEPGPDYCYEVKNMRLGNMQISFLLFPQEKNKIDFIMVQSGGQLQSLNGSYRLDEQEAQFAELYKNAKQEDQSKYDFDRFFLATFSETQSFDSIDAFDNNTVLNEDKFVRSFKSTKLFGPEWDFTSVDDFLYVTYENVLLEKKPDNTTYIAQIQTSDISTHFVHDGKDISVRWELSGNYWFLPNHSFSDIALTFINPSVKNTKIYLLSGNNIYIEEDISISNISLALQPLFIQLGSLQSIHSFVTQNSNISSNEMQYSYIPSQQQSSVIFSDKGVDIQLIINSSGTTVIYDNKKMVENISQTNELNNILETILQ